MLYAFQPLLCLKLCWHNRLKPNPKGFWSYINSKIKVNTGIASLTTSNGDSATTPLQKSELLNSYFSSVFTSECLETLPGMGDFNSLQLRRAT